MDNTQSQKYQVVGHTNN